MGGPQIFVPYICHRMSIPVAHFPILSAILSTGCNKRGNIFLGKNLVNIPREIHYLYVRTEHLQRNGLEEGLSRRVEAYIME